MGQDDGMTRDGGGRGDAGDEGIGRGGEAGHPWILGAGVGLDGEQGLTDAMGVHEMRRTEAFAPNHFILGNWRS